MEVDDWVATYRRLWVERLDRLDDYFRDLQARPITEGAVPK